MKLNSYWLIYVLTALLFILNNNAVAISSENENLVDPMVPKLLNEKKTDIKQKAESIVAEAEQFNLTAIGHSDYAICCIINGNILSIDDTIDAYTIQDIQKDTVILINKEEKIKILTID
jgi:hypothetical protein